MALDTTIPGGIEQGAEAVPMYSLLSPFPSSANRPGRGVNEMRTKPSFKVGRVTVSRTGDKEWLLRYRDPQTQRDVRRRFRNTTEKEFQDVAAAISHEALSMKGYLPGKIKHALGLAVMARLQGLAGLRMLEAAAIRRQDVDLEAGTVSITETPLHKPKNAFSFRTIPLCREALEALRGAIGTQKIIPPGGELSVNHYGAPWNLYSLSEEWTVSMRRAAAALAIPRLAAIPARKLRAAFATMAIRLGCQEDLVRPYVGHAANSILTGHYRKITLADLKTVSARMDGWRNPVSEVSEWHNPGTSSEMPLASQL